MPDDEKDKLDAQPDNEAQADAVTASNEQRPAPKKKKPRHTNFVVPGSGDTKKNSRIIKQAPQKNPDRLGRRAQRKDAPSAASQHSPEAASSLAEYGFGDNATPFYGRRSPARRKVRRKRNWRRIRNLLVLLLLVCLVVFFATGAYLPAWISVSEAAANLRSKLQKGNGYPMSMALIGYRDAQTMGSGGFAALSESDLVMVSDSGKELDRIQHNMTNPYITTSKSRVCVYDRGGTNYIVQNRNGTYYTGSADKNILFTQLSPGGWLAVCTSSRSQFEVAVYSPTLTGGWQMNWSSSEDIPLRAAFHSDNRTLALGCISSNEGTMDTIIHILRTDRSPARAQLASVSVPGAVPMEMLFLSSGRLLVLYNTGHAAVYNTHGEELARYDYAGRSLYTASHHAGQTALLFGTADQDTADLVLLDNQLQPLMQSSVAALGSMQVLAQPEGVYLLNGQEITAYAPSGPPADAYRLEGKAYGLVYGGTALALSAGQVEDISTLLLPKSVAQQPAGAASGSGVSGDAQSDANPASAAQSEAA